MMRRGHTIHGFGHSAGHPLHGMPSLAQRGGGGGVQYGRAISFTLATGTSLDASKAYGIDGRINWRPRGSSLQYEDGTESGATVTEGASNSTNAALSRGVDDGSDDYDLFELGRLGSTLETAFYTISNIPFSRYDIRLYWAQDTSVIDDDLSDRVGFTMKIGTQKMRSILTTRNGYQGTLIETDRAAQTLWQPGPADDANVIVFRDLTGATATLEMENPLEGRHWGFAGVAGIQVLERTDSLSTIAVETSRNLYLNGDSYMDNGAASALPLNNSASVWANCLISDMAVRRKLYTDSITNVAVSGTPMADQSTIHLAADLTNSAVIWWDGSTGNIYTLSDYEGYIDALATKMGNGRWCWVVSLPTPSHGDATNAILEALYDDVRDYILANYEPKNVYDPRPALVALDPENVGVGGLPPSAFSDTLHLTDDALWAVVEDAREKEVLWNIIKD